MYLFTRLIRLNLQPAAFRGQEFCSLDQVGLWACQSDWAVSASYKQSSVITRYAFKGLMYEGFLQLFVDSTLQTANLDP